VRQKKRGLVTHGEAPLLKTISHRHDADPGQDNTAKRTATVARGFIAPPSGGRARHLIIIPDCPNCQGLHIHFSVDGRIGRRKGSCGHPYVVRIAGQKRAGWSR
jgi:hypothetical protein